MVCRGLAEREGFEPSVQLPVQRFSRPSRSTTPASFLFDDANVKIIILKYDTFRNLFFRKKHTVKTHRYNYTV